MCMIIVCVVEVQFLINTLGNWLELPPHPLLFSKGGGAFGIKKIIADFFMDRLPFWFVGTWVQNKDLSDWKVVFWKWTDIFLWHHVFLAGRYMGAAMKSLSAW